MQTQAPTPAVMDVDTAYATVHQRVYSPVFFEKLANDYGIHPQTEQDQMRMLTMASKLRNAHDVRTKQAAQRRNPLEAAERHLDAKLTKMGFAVQRPNAINPNRVKAAAAHASFDPELAAAVLSLQAQANGATVEQLNAALSR